MAAVSSLAPGLRDRAGVVAPYWPALTVVAIQLVFYGVPAGVWIQGVVLGLLNALVALGLALIWRSNRVLNFAQADMGTLPAAFGAAFCVFWGWSWFAGFFIGLAGAVVVGLATEYVVIRRFRDAPRLTLTVATIGIAQFCILAALLLPRLWGSQVLTSAERTGYAFPWDFDVEFRGAVFHADDLVAVILGVAVLAGVSWFLARSDTGIAIRASAEQSSRAELLGVPVLRMESITWVVAAVLSFLGVFLQGAILGFPLNATVGIVTLVTALAALAMGGFERIGPILASAVGLGVLLQGARWHHPVQPSFVYAVLGAVIAVVMLVRRGGLRRSDRDALSSWLASLEPRPLPAALRRRGVPVVAACLAVVVAAVVPTWLTEAQQYDLATLAAFGVVALSIAVLTGWAGQITLGQMGFAALGAALGAVTTVSWNLDVVLGLVIVVVAGALAGVVVGLPSLRFSGLLPAAVTLAFGLAASGYLFDPNQFDWIPSGPVVPQPAFGTWSIAGPLGAYEFCLVVLVLATIGLVGIRASAVGRAIRAVRDNDATAQSYAVSAATAKLGAYGISGALAAAGGFLLVHVAQNFDAATYAPAESLTIFTAAVVGGVGSLFGVLLGAGYLNGSRWLLSGYWQLLPTAVGVLVVLWLFPGGLSSVIYRLRDRLAHRRAAALGIDLLGPATEEPPEATTAAGGGGSVRADDGAAENPLLQVRGVRVAYGDVDILFGVDLEVRRGEIVAVLGTNGAGKSTLLRAVSGVAPMTAGSVHFDGQDLTGVAAPTIARTGLAQMPGGRAVFETLTVAENLRVAAWLRRGDEAALRRRLTEIDRQFPILAERRDEPAANLSGGQQQLLGLAMVLLGDPELVLIDELTLGLSPLAAHAIVDQVRALRDSGTTVVLVEQSVEVALALADRAYFLERGAVRFAGPTAELRDRPDLLRAVYLSGAPGETPAVTAPSATSEEIPLLARLRDVSVFFDGPAVLSDVDLDVHDGEILTVIGPNGAGKTTLFDVLSGFTPVTAGSVELFGTPVTARGAAYRARLGLGRSFQDSRLFPALTVAETVAVATNRWVTRPDPVSAALRLPVRQLSEAATAERVAELIDSMGLSRLAHHRIGELSTGQRRLVDIAAALAHAPRLLLLDEPSSGVARAEAEALVAMLRSLRTTLGATLVVVEHDMDIATALGDRMVALDLGNVVTSGPPEEVLADPRVVESYLGRPARTGPPADQGAPPR